MDSGFYFNLKEAKIYQAVKWAKNPVFVFAGLLQKIFFILFFISLTLFLYGFLSFSFSDSSNSALLGLSIIFLTVGVYCKLTVVFLNSKLKNPNPAESNNLADYLSFEAARVIARTKINSTAALLNSLIGDNPESIFIFSRLLLDVKEVKNILKEQILKDKNGGKKNFSPEENFEKVLWDSLKIARERGRQKIRSGDILAALAKSDPVFQTILLDSNLKIQDIENLTWWYESLKEKIERNKKWWQYENLMKRGTLAKEWTAGYTIALDKYSADWTEIAKKSGFPEIVGHKGEIEQVERVLARNEYNNVLLVGEPGVGRKGIIQGLVKKSSFGQSLPDVNYKRVVELDLARLLAAIQNPEEVEAVLDAIFQEAVSAGNVILVINEFHNYIAVKQGPGQVDISGVISSYLHLAEFQVVAVTSFAGLHKNIEQNPSILNLFEKVEVSEIPDHETLMILENLIPFLEQKYKLFVSYPALREIISLSRRFLPSLPFPKKSMDLLDEAMIYVKKTTKEKAVLPRHIAEIIKEKTQVPVGEMEAREKEILLNMENLIHQRIINQEQAVKEVSSALRRARAEVQVRSAPMGNFLFLGPTGVGKTETSKALAEIYFGSESKMIRLDMSEFQSVSDIPRLIGSPGEEGFLTTKVRENPFSIILLDEIEKAHPNILNLFLQVLDEGFLTDGLGRKVDFKNSIIIATSNAGYQVILKALESKTEWSLVKEKLLGYLFENALFRPEFINRFDAVVVFQPLSKEHLLKIAGLMLNKLKKNLKERGIDFIVTMPLEEKIVDLSYDITFGAREMKRVIQDKIENVLASALLSGKIKRGDRIGIDPDEFKLKIQ